MLDVRALRYFLAVARTLHFGRAAEQLHISQPPLSRQISLLEEHFGVSLFRRNAHRVALTIAGEELQREAERIVAQLEQLPGRVLRAASGHSGTLTIGFTMYAALSVVPGLARRFKNAYPEVELKLLEVVANDLTAQLTEGKIDIAVMLPVGHQPGVVQREVLVEPLVLALPTSHALAEAEEVDLSMFSTCPFVAATAEASPALRRAIVDACLASGFVPNIRMEVRLQQTVLSLVAEGIGVALVPNSMHKVRLEGVRFKPIRATPKIQQVMAWSESTSNPCVRNLLLLQGIGGCETDM